MRLLPKGLKTRDKDGKNERERGKEVKVRKEKCSASVHVTSRRSERERRRKKTNGWRADPVAVGAWSGGYPLLSSSSLSSYRHGDYHKNSELVQLYPSKNGQNLYFLFLHPQT